MYSRKLTLLASLYLSFVLIAHKECIEIRRTLLGSEDDVKVFTGIDPPCGEYIPRNKSNCDSGTNNLSSGRILSGKLVHGLGHFPHHVKLRVEFKTGGRFRYCGGTIIEEDAVLSNVMCVAPQLCNPIYYGTAIKVVVISVGKIDEEDIGLEYEVAEAIPHPDFSCTIGATFGSDYLYTENNIAILKMRDRFTFALFEDRVGINKVCLPPRDIDYNEIMFHQKLVAYIPGWGGFKRPQVSQNQSKILRWGLGHVVEWRECKKRLNASTRPYNIPLDPNTVCTGLDDDFNDAIFCRGDYGGGLVRNIPGTCRWELVGIVDRELIPGGYCQRAPFSYSRVASYIDWIGRCLKKVGSSCKTFSY